MKLQDWFKINCHFDGLGTFCIVLVVEFHLEGSATIQGHIVKFTNNLGFLSYAADPDIKSRILEPYIGSWSYFPDTGATSWSKKFFWLLGQALAPDAI